MIGLLVLLFVRRGSIDALSVLVHPLVLRHGSAELVGTVMAAGTVGFAVAGVALTLLRVERPLRWILAASAVGALGMTVLAAGTVPAVFVLAAVVIYAADLATISANQLWWQRAEAAHGDREEDVLEHGGSAAGDLLQRQVFQRGAAQARRFRGADGGAWLHREAGAIAGRVVSPGP